MNVQRAYSLFEVKGLDATKRQFSGIATTPTPDRVGDTVNPKGIRFTNPVTLLHQHDHSRPVGLARFGNPSAKGVPFDAEIPLIEEPGPLKDRVDTAWGEIKYGLVRAVSIGFRPIKWAYRDDGGIDFEDVEVYELSSVSVPAQSEAIITAIKSLQEGRPLPRDVVALLRQGDDRSVKLISRAALPRDMQGAVPLILPNHSE